MLVGIEGESEGYRMSIVLAGVLTVYLRVQRFYCQLANCSPTPLSS
jgi:hypothetical protein